nr:FAD:protein FMN transferase [uncultured Schaedlerella sp.]
MKPASHTFFLYNTICSAVIYDERDDAEILLRGVKKRAMDIRRMLDFYDPESELGRLNRKHRTGIPERLSRELCTFIMHLLDFSEKSGGCFDPSVGPAVRLWNIPSQNPRVPESQEIERVMKQTGAASISCDERECTVTFRKPGMMLDAGAAGKGYAVGKAVEYLKSSGVRSAAVNFGGNLFVLGQKPSADGTERPWKVGIQSPWKDYAQNLGILSLEDCGAATSGGYDRFFTEEGKVYHHLIDPRTGYPTENTLDSVTVVSQNAFYTDLLSTACFIAGEESVGRICRSVDKNAGYVLVKKDGSVILSENLKGRFQQEGGQAVT